MPLLLVSLVMLAVGGTSTRGESTATTRAMSEPIKVVTFNLRNSGAKDGVNAWAGRKDAVIAHLRKLSPDLLGVQEAMPDQHDALAAAMADYAAVGAGREDGKRQGEFATLFIRKDRFEVVKSGTFWLSPTPEVVGSKYFDAALTRICTWAVLREKVGGREFVFANTHFDHVGLLSRESAAKLIGSKLPTIGPDLPIVLTGDFNADDTTTAYKAIVAAGLIDAYRTIHPTHEENEASFNAFRGTVKGRRIDYVFTSPDWKTTAAEIDRTKRGEGLYLSDHYPVGATIERK